MNLRVLVLALVAFVVAGFSISMVWGKAPVSSYNIALVIVSVAVYAVIGFGCRTSTSDEYFVAGRRVSPLANGMATASDWMSAASFIGLTGILMTLGLTGDGQQHGGLVYLLGWTGGFVVLITLFVRKVNDYGVYSIPELLQKRFGGRSIRLIAAVGTFICSGIYLVAQIYGIGLVTSLLSGMTFELGVFLALGGVLLCSFLGGMRAITWTQVVQCVVIVGVMMLVAATASWKISGHPVVSLSGASALQRVEALATQIRQDPRERDVQRILLDRPLQSEADAGAMRFPAADSNLISPAARARQSMNGAQVLSEEREEIADRIHRPVGFAGSASGPARVESSPTHVWINSFALVFCLMVGTASLPHVLMRSLTTATPRQAQTSIIWAMVFVALVYLSASSLAIMAKSVVLDDLVGASYEHLPSWVNQLRYKKLGLLSLNDLNGDGVVQFAEIGFYADYLILGVPEVMGLPPIFLGLLAMGAMAAALSTADGLLLTLSNALVHDGLYVLRPSNPDPIRKVVLSKILLLIVALMATWLAANRVVNILSWISYAFSLAAATFFPVLVLGLCCKKAARKAAIAAMVSGISITLYYMMQANGWLGVPMRWWGVDPMAGGLFGVVAGLVIGYGLTWLAPAQADPVDVARQS